MPTYIQPDGKKVHTGGPVYTTTAPSIAITALFNDTYRNIYNAILDGYDKKDGAAVSEITISRIELYQSLQETRISNTLKAPAQEAPNEAKVHFFTQQILRNFADPHYSGILYLSGLDGIRKIAEQGLGKVKAEASFTTTIFDLAEQAENGKAPPPGKIPGNK